MVFVSVINPVLNARALVPVSSEEYWFPTGIGNFHHMQFGFDRVWTNQLFQNEIGDGIGRTISIKPTDIDNYKVLNIAGNVYSIAVDDKHDCLWAVGGAYGLAKISKDNAHVKYYPAPEGYSVGLQVTWDGKYLWMGAPEKVCCDSTQRTRLGSA